MPTRSVDHVDGREQRTVVESGPVRKSPFRRNRMISKIGPELTKRLFAANPDYRPNNKSDNYSKYYPNHSSHVKELYSPARANVNADLS